MTALHACPECSVIRPDAALDSERPVYARFPTIRCGRVTKLHSILREPTCKHGPHLPESSPDAEALVKLWNDWVVEAANAKADRLALDPTRRSIFLYWVGIGDNPALAAYKQGVTVKPFAFKGNPQFAQPVASIQDPEDRRLVRSLGDAVADDCPW